MNDKILEKLAKLKAMQESACEIGNEAEAMAFASRIQTLLFKYKIGMAELESFSLEDPDSFEVDQQYFTWEGAGISGSSKRSSWLEKLALFVCHYNNCKILVNRGSNAVFIVGTEESRAVVSYLLNMLAKFGKREMEAGYRKAYYEAKKQNATYLMKGWKKSFINAYVSRVGQRMKEDHDRMKAEEVSERGLMVLDKEISAVDDYIHNMKNLTEAKSIGNNRNYNHNGALSGENAGNKVNIKANGIDEKSKCAVCI